MFYGYRIIAAGCVIQAMYLGAIFSFGVLFPSLETEFGWSRATISGATSIAFLLNGVVIVFMGRINDRIGPRKLLGLAGVVFGLGHLSLYQMESVWQLYLLYGVLVGVGFGAHDVGTLSTVARWYVKDRGAMTGLVKAGAGIGQLLFPLGVAVLVATYGWRAASLTIGIVALVGIVVAAQVLRRDPAEVGMQPLGAQDVNEPGRAQSEAGLGLSAALSTSQFWILALSKFADLFCLVTVTVHIVPICIDQGLSPATAAQVLSTIGGASILGRILFGGSFDRFGAKRSLSLCFAVLLGSVLWLQVADVAWMLFVFALGYGAAHGGFFTLLSPSVAEYFGTRAHGVIFGAIFFGGSVGGTLGPLVAGRLFDISGSYDSAFLVLTGFSLFGLILALGLRPLGSDQTNPLK